MARFLVTTALPYANGSSHLGHILESIQADIWVRFQKMQGNQCLFVSGEDAHGTPVMLKAKQQKMTPEAFVQQARKEHLLDYKHFLIDFSHFHTTHSEENRSCVNTLYERLKIKQDIIKAPVEQAYDHQERMFLSDRFIKGDCPAC